MFAVEVDSFFSRILAAWLFFTMFAFFAAVLSPGVLTIPVVVAWMGFTYWCVDCAYRTEHFARYAAFRLFSILGLAPVITFVCALMTAHKELKLGPLDSAVFGCFPVVVAVLAYMAVYRWRGQQANLVVRGQRAEVTEAAPNHRNNALLGGLAAGLSSLIYPVFKSSNISTLWLLIVLMALSLFVILYYRNQIAALRELRKREARDCCRYTFMNIEEIRQKRASSLLGRIFTAKARR